MSRTALERYIERLPRIPMPGRRIWLDDRGQARGRYFNCTLTSVFQPLRRLATGRVAGYEAFIRSAADGNPGLSVWRLLEGAASDDESVELDRLCRMLHAVNFFRQPGAEGADLYLGVHERLLAAVGNDHGMVFRRVLESLGLPLERNVLQLPQARPGHRFLLQYVGDNYQRSGFRVALNAADAREGLRMLDMMRPDVIKVDARELGDADGARVLARECGERGVGLVFKRVEARGGGDLLRRAGQGRGGFLVQGWLWDQAEPLLVEGASQGDAGAGSAGKVPSLGLST
jgi:EAL domain-containing protein (putative c-di-GMP-specific phosphodiesterase class I)